MRALVWFRQQGGTRIYAVRPRTDGETTAEPISLEDALRREATSQTTPGETVPQTADKATQTDPETVQHTADKAVQTESEQDTTSAAADDTLADGDHQAADKHDDGPEGQGWDLDVGDDGKLRMKYKGICGLRHPSVNGGNGVAFEFPDRISALLCYRTVNVPADPHCDKTSKVVSEVMHRHVGKIMNMRAWECQFCGKPSKATVHSPIPFLNPLSSDTYFQPYIFDFVVPVCRSLGECDRKGDALLQEVAKECFRGNVVINNPSCQKCGGVKSLLHCGRCKLVKYCSRGCQVSDWSSHRDDCRLVQQEIAVMEKPEEPPVIEQPKKKVRKRPNRKRNAGKRKAEGQAPAEEQPDGTA